MSADSAKPVFRAEEKELYACPDNASKGAHVVGIDAYRALYKESTEGDVNAFWDKMAKQHITFFQPYTSVQSGSFVEGDVAWFLNGKLNVSYNCLDRHLATRADQVCLVLC
jgi:acetyl-CoA synthetase